MGGLFSLFGCGQCNGRGRQLFDWGNDLSCGRLHFCLLGGHGLGISGFALLSLGQYFSFLAADQLGLALCINFTALEFRLVNDSQGCGNRFRSDHHRRGDFRRFWAIIALDESALFAHFYLNGAGFAGGIGLLDFAGGFFDQSDFFALSRLTAMAGLEVIQ